MVQTLTSPNSKTLRLVASRKTTLQTDQAAKPVPVKFEEVEILVSDSRLAYWGSQFGHTAIAIDGTVYGRAHPAWDISSRDVYLRRQREKMRRDTWGYVLRVSPQEKAIILKEIKHRAMRNEPYSLSSNSCSSNIAEIFDLAGIPVHDPRWNFGAISPADLMTGLAHSPRLKLRKTYPKP
ncbi:DUF4105 domain-containing protein [Vogesella sp. LIG4]|uniref:lipoprotein N-acyltransferase Lnb domain-containing protein n=1 Tax=Vogesella sp. LIG4 TaxID=1192162 RepID=UPI00081F81C6|nr:DUF4105 domain-containing protein [Vogesella sp. LIG4]SCK17922.1 protein of unknown function [Vogesella sp. LIG4]